MIWADRLGIVWLIIVAAVLLLMQGTTIGHMEWGVLLAVAIGAGVPWLLLRALDFVFTGTVRPFGRRERYMTIIR